MKKDLSSDNERAYCELHDLCNFVEGKTAVSDLNETNYISTENMLQNKGGITKAAILPSVSKTQIYRSGDVLVSNIRPYFKKIWLASYDGGCSNDVLVMRPKNGVDNSFLYYLLADDRFFDYATSTSKGTKMPRGDRSAIMKYRCWAPEFSVQRVIGAFLKSLDDKITLNQKLNRNLAAQIRTLCDAWLNEFVPFEGTCPDDWRLTPLSAVANFIGGYSYKGSELQESTIAMATIKNFDRNGGFKLSGYKEIVPSSKLKPEHSVTLFDTLVAHTDLTQKAEVIGNAEPVLSFSGYKDIIFSMDLVKVVPKNSDISKFLIAAILQTQQFKEHCLGYVNGTTVLHLSKKALQEFCLMLPENLSVLKPLDEVVSSMYRQMASKIDENLRLMELRDALLPKLMSGEIDVSKLDI